MREQKDAAAFLDKEYIINKLYGAYVQMRGSGEVERAKGLYRAIKLIRKCPSFEFKRDAMRMYYNK